MKLFVGTSGYSYKEWKGSFYPEKLPAAQMLHFYAQHFNTVESNSTFRSMPAPEVLVRWAKEVPAGFTFALKAPQRITHFQRLRVTTDAAREFADAAGVLRTRLGPLLFQLPPTFKKDVPRLREFLAALPRSRRAAFEFRHPSWSDDEVFAALSKAKAAWCVADTDEEPATEIRSTTDWGYLRLRRAEYDDKELRAWLKRIRSQPWKKCFVYFKHEDEARGPRFARRFVELAQ